MKTDLVTIQGGALSANVQNLIEVAKVFVTNAESANTRINYESAFSRFTSFCASLGVAVEAATFETVALYITALAESGKKPSTIDLHLSAIRAWFKRNGLNNPCDNEAVKLVRRGIRRTIGTKQNKKTAIIRNQESGVDDLGKLLSNIENNLKGKRDRAMILLGFAGALRRSEIVGLDIEDLEYHAKGLILHLRKSKTDQEGKGQTVEIPFGIATTALDEWLEAGEITAGAVFRHINKGGAILERCTPKTVERVVKDYADKAGLDAKQFAGHSLRSGLATSAAMAGHSERSIAKQTRHKSMVVLRGYIQDGERFKENALQGLGI